MVKEMTPIDVTNTPELLQLAEEVRRNGQARVLRRDREDLAVVIPVSAAKRRARKTRTYSKEDDEAFLASAGGWKDFDLEKFLRDIDESRRISRPPVEL